MTHQHKTFVPHTSHLKFLILSLFGLVGCAGSAYADDEYPIEINNTSPYTGQWRLEGDDYYSSGTATRVLPVGRYVLIIGEYARFAFSVGDDGTTVVEDEYKASLADGHRSIEFHPQSIEMHTGDYAGEWKIHRVTNENSGQEVWLMPYNAENDDRTYGAPYRLSIADDTSAVRLEISSTTLTFSAGDNAGLGGIRIEGTHEVHFDTRRIKVSEVTDLGETWRFRGFTDNFGEAYVELIPEIPFYFIGSNGIPNKVDVTVDCQVTPRNIIAGDAEYQLECADSDYEPLPDSVIVETDIGTYEITTIVGSFHSLRPLLEDQDWYTDSDAQNDIAMHFSDKLGDRLGRPNFYLEESKPPAFAYDIKWSDAFGSVVFAMADDSFDPDPNEVVTWAIGYRVDPPSVPNSPEFRSGD